MYIEDYSQPVPETQAERADEHEPVAVNIEECRIDALNYALDRILDNARISPAFKRGVRESRTA